MHQPWVASRRWRPTASARRAAESDSSAHPVMLRPIEHASHRRSTPSAAMVRSPTARTGTALRLCGTARYDLHGEPRRGQTAPSSGSAAALGSEAVTCSARKPRMSRTSAFVRLGASGRTSPMATIQSSNCGFGPSSSEPSFEACHSPRYLCKVDSGPERPVAPLPATSVSQIMSGDCFAQPRSAETNNRLATDRGVRTTRRGASSGDPAVVTGDANAGERFSRIAQGGPAGLWLGGLSPCTAGPRQGARRSHAALSTGSPREQAREWSRSRVSERTSTSGRSQR